MRPKITKMVGSEIISGHLPQVTGGLLRFGVGHLLSIRVFENLPSSLIWVLTRMTYSRFFTCLLIQFNRRTNLMVRVHFLKRVVDNS